VHAVLLSGVHAVMDVCGRRKSNLTSVVGSAGTTVCSPVGHAAADHPMRLEVVVNRSCRIVAESQERMIARHHTRRSHVAFQARVITLVCRRLEAVVQIDASG